MENDNDSYAAFRQRVVTIITEKAADGAEGAKTALDVLAHSPGSRVHELLLEAWENGEIISETADLLMDTVIGNP